MQASWSGYPAGAAHERQCSGCTGSYIGPCAPHAESRCFSRQRATICRQLEEALLSFGSLDACFLVWCDQGPLGKRQGKCATRNHLCLSSRCFLRILTMIRFFHFTLAQHTAAVFSSGTSRSDQDYSASARFKRMGGWSAEEVARLHHDAPCLQEDRYLACWWRTIVHTAGRCARSFINRAFPENRIYGFCKLPQWPTALPWIAGPRDPGQGSKEAPVPGNGSLSSGGACAQQATPVPCCNDPPLAHDPVPFATGPGPHASAPSSPGKPRCCCRRSYSQASLMLV